MSQAKQRKPRLAPTARKYQPRKPLAPTFKISHPGDLNPWARSAFNTGMTCVGQQKWDEAAQAFYRALETERYFLDAHYWIALLATEPVEKRRHLEEVIAMRPNHMEAIHELMVLDGKLDPDSAALDPYAEPEKREARGAVGIETTALECAQCGSPQMTINDETGLATCGSCGHVQERHLGAVEQGMLTMALLQRRSKAVRWVVGKYLLACENCGAERTLSARKMAQQCPFCGSTHVIEQDALESFQQPDGLIPFKVTRAVAGDIIKMRLAGFGERVKGWFVKKRVQQARMTGIYLPFWVFDAAVDVRQTVTRMPSENESYNRNLLGSISQSLVMADAMNNVLVYAAKSPSPKLVQQVGRYHFIDTVPYEPALLAKYSAELYSIDFDDASLEARGQIGRAMREKYTRRASGMTVNIFTEFRQVSFRLLLLPVWVATLIEEDGDIRPALVNGQTGQVVLGRARKPD